MVDLESISVVLLGHSGKSGPALEGKDVQPDLLTADGPSRSADLEAVDTSVDFVLDPALASEAHASLPQADTLASVPADVDMEKDLETEKYDLMLLRDKYGDKVVMRASEAEIMNVLTGSYVRVRARVALHPCRADHTLFTSPLVSPTSSTPRCNLSLGERSLACPCSISRKRRGKSRRPCFIS